MINKLYAIHGWTHTMWMHNMNGGSELGGGEGLLLSADGAGLLEAEVEGGDELVDLGAGVVRGEAEADDCGAERGERVLDVVGVDL